MDQLFQFTPVALAAIPVVTGLVEMLKSLSLPTKFAPLVSIVLGGLLVALSGEPVSVAILQGIIVGLAASGLYSGGRATRTMIAPNSVDSY